MKLINFLLLAIASINTTAQTSYTGRIIDENQHPVQDVNIVLYRSETSVIGYGFSGTDGKFDVSYTKEVKPVSIGFILLGYETKRIKSEDFQNSQDIVLKSTTYQLKEVNIRPNRIRQNKDTLVYNVISFKQNQDRSISDVINKMPGLEVKQDGTISFEGKPINKFYIEGMDLMGSKYSQASENINADLISNVQVIQNHQPIKALKGIRFSDQAALNIVLKENVKNVWSGTLDAGTGISAQKGTDYLYNGRLMGMVFGRERQNLSLYKCDNTGKDISKEVSDLTTQLRDNQEESGLLRPLVIPATEIDDGRTTFNESHLVATNHLVKTPNNNDVRIQLDYLWNRKKSNTTTVTEYLDLNGIILSEENAVSSTDSHLKGNFTYKVNKEQLYVNNRLHGNVTVDRSNGISVLDDEKIMQNVRLKKYHITEDFEMISHLKNGNSIEISSQSTYSYLPGKILTVKGFNEKLDISTFETHSYATFNHKIKGFTLSQRIGYKLKHQKIDVNYPEVNNIEKYTQQNLYVASGLNLDRNSFKLRAIIKADFMQRNYEKDNDIRITLQPNLNLQYDCNSTTSASLNYNYQERPDALTALYRTPIFTSYRVQTSHTGNLENRGIHTLYLALKYKHPIKGLFLSTMASWTRRTHETLYQSEFDASVYKRTPTEQQYDADSYWIGCNVAQSFYWGKTLVSLDYRQIWSDYYLIQKTIKVPWQMQNTELTFKLSMQLAKIFSYELYSKLQTGKQVNQKDNNLSNERLTSFNHGISLFLFPVKNLELGFKSDFYHHSDKSISGNMFTDIHLSYQLKQYEFRLNCNNIFGNNLYERRLQTSTTDVYSSYRLRPREILFAFSIEF
ncbi:hypothetical protein [Bacteroides sp.]|uniref:hypothetical protein n=1 Tax=Bacteroides sp. TaxID=29523 RepID=UPI0023D23FDD|nr:hypothetical protein [Bacteroides sp.]MDE6216629.1 hypothetical protein [Bacteroides sp.]